MSNNVPSGGKHNRRKRDILGPLSEISFVEGNLRKLTAYVLCLFLLVMLVLCFLVNVWEGNRGLLPPLLIAGAPVVVALLWLYFQQSAEIGPLYLAHSSMILLGGYLLFNIMAPEGSSLFWFLLYPPMAMFCFGLRKGTIAFFLCMLSFSCILFTPLHYYLAQPLSPPVKIRFIIAMFGAFAFSLGIEYSRLQTRKVLANTLARLEQDSLTDLLTGLGNRRSFYNYFSISFLSSSSSRHTFSLASADIDHFKKINDTYGHEVGDKVLRHISDILRAQSRESDRIYRWGGEEFLILMPITGTEQARLVLDRMRRKIQDTPCIGDNGEKIALTASFGYCSGAAGDNLEAKIAEADRCLYEAKRSGRNCVVGSTATTATNT